MSEVVDEQLVVYVVIGRRPEPQPGEDPVPDMLVLRVDQAQPVCIQGAEGHVGPHVRRYDSCGHHQGNENHQKGISGRAVERIE